MRESEIEARFKERCLECGFLVRKLRWVGRNGAPDRIVIGIGARGPFVAFAEIKATGVEPQGYQLREHEKLRAAGAVVHVINSLAGIEEFLEAVL